MQPPARIPDPGNELALDEAVHVFIGPAHPGRIAPAVLENFGKALNDLASVVAIDRRRAFERRSPRQAARNVVFEQAPVEREGDAEVERRRVGSRVEAAGPEVLAHGFATAGCLMPAAAMPPL